MKSQDHIYKIGIFKGSAMNKSAEAKILDLFLNREREGRSVGRGRMEDM